MAPTRQFNQGDVSVILNGLVRDGVIAGFETSFSKDDPRTRRVRIEVTVDSATAPDAAKRAVEHALDRFSVMVSATVKAG